MLFDTAWSIPWPIFERLAELFPQLTIEGEIFEDINPFGGDIRCHAGELHFIDKSAEIEARMKAAFKAEMDAESKAAPAPANDNPTEKGEVK